MSSGIDFTSLCSKDEKNSSDNEENTNQVRKTSTASSKTKGSSSSTLNKEVDDLGDIQRQTEEKTGLLKKMEASSEGKVKGSLLLDYFKSADRMCTLIFLFISFLLTQFLANCADVWVSYWYVSTQNCYFSFNFIFYNIMLTFLVPKIKD